MNILMRVLKNEKVTFSTRLYHLHMNNLEVKRTCDHANSYCLSEFIPWNSKETKEFNSSTTLYLITFSLNEITS